MTTTNTVNLRADRCDFAKVAHQIEIDRMLARWESEERAYQAALEVAASLVAAERLYIRAIHTARALEGDAFAIAALAMMDA